MFNRMAGRLTGEGLFLNKRLQRDEYEKARSFAAELKRVLETWGWKPKDMIDVQSFLWGVDQSWDAVEEAEDEERSETVKEAPGSSATTTPSPTNTWRRPSSGPFWRRPGRRIWLAGSAGPPVPTS